MACPERNSLLQEYERFVLLYGDAVRQFKSIAVGDLSAERNFASAIVDFARQDVREAFKLLSQHTAAHRCQRLTATASTQLVLCRVPAPDDGL